MHCTSLPFGTDFVTLESEWNPEYDEGDRSRAGAFKVELGVLRNSQH